MEVGPAGGGRPPQLARSPVGHRWAAVSPPAHRGAHGLDSCPRPWVKSWPWTSLGTSGSPHGFIAEPLGAIRASNLMARSHGSPPRGWAAREISPPIYLGVGGMPPWVPDSDPPHRSKTGEERWAPRWASLTAELTAGGRAAQ